MLIHQFVEFNAREYPDTPALKMGERQLSFAQLDADVNRLANGLLANGLGAGSRLALLAKNCIEYPQLVLACAKAGITLVPLNYRLAPAELAYIVQQSDASAVVAGDEELRANIDAIDALDGVRNYYSLANTDSKWQPFNELYSDDTHAPAVTLDEDSVIYQMYTSGTTGLPKGVMVSHRQIVPIVSMMNSIPPRRQVGDYGLMPLPLFHVAGLAAAVVWLSTGMTVELMADFDPVGLVKTIVAQQQVDLVLVPAMIQAILAFVPNIADYDFTPLKRIVYGASPISAEVLRQAIAVFDCDFVQGFGMTEVSGMVLTLQAADHRRALAGEEQLLRSCGRPLPGVSLKVIDDDGRELPAGETGELLIRTPSAMQGYYKQPEKTAETIQHGWLHTGDGGYVDAEGFFYIRDRIKDMIVSGGENVYPAEIENVLFSHPAVQDATVIGIPDERFGEAPLAFCVLAPDAELDAGQLESFCRERLAGYKVPRHYEFISEIPRNPSGKVLKRVLREPYWENAERQVG